MSGIGIALAAGQPASGGTSPLSLSLTYDGPVTTRVQGASGDTITATPPGYSPGPLAPQMDYALHLTATGGTPPYSYNCFADNDPSGKLGVTGSGDTWAITWSGMSLNEAESVRVNAHITDSASGSSSRANTWLIQRVS